jgi:hypothetical protein
MPGDNSAWTKFIEEQNSFEKIENKLLEYTLKIFHEMVQTQMKLNV